MKKKKPIPPAFVPFVSAVETQLRFLEEDFGLVRGEVYSTPPECVITYRRDDLMVRARYEYGTPPWTSVALIDEDGGWKEVAIDWLKTEAAKKRRESSWSGEVDEINGVVAAEAAALKRLLPSLLRSGQQQVDRALARSRIFDCQTALRHLDAMEPGDSSRFPAKDRAYLLSLKESLQAGEPRAILKHLDSELQLRHRFSPATLRKPGVKLQLARLTNLVQECLE